MANPKTTIELNGKLYDARTGHMIQASEVSDSKQPTKSTAKTSLGALDGLAHRPAVQREHPLPIRKREHKPSHTNRNPKKSNTLMRPAVKKPQPPKMNIQNDIQPAKKPSLAHGSSERNLRAQQTQKSNLIKRFDRSGVSSVQKKSEVLPVAKRENYLTAKAHEIAASTENQVSQSTKKVEAAIANASSHLMQLEKNLVDQKSFLERVLFKNKAANLASVFAAALLLFGFFAYQNAANIEMRIAAARSGISAQLPGYSPAGFGVSNRITAEPGKVTVTFSSRSDNRKFRLSQQASDWSSDALLSNHVLSSNQPFQTYQGQDKTVYIYDNSNATWVDGGIWYKVEGNASLTSDQLLRLANSL